MKQSLSNIISRFNTGVQYNMEMKTNTALTNYQIFSYKGFDSTRHYQSCWHDTNYQLSLFHIHSRHLLQMCKIGKTGNKLTALWGYKIESEMVHITCIMLLPLLIKISNRPVIIFISGCWNELLIAVRDVRNCTSIMSNPFQLLM